MSDEELAMILLGRLTFRLEKLAREHAALREASAALGRQNMELNEKLAVSE